MFKKAKAKLLTRLFMEWVSTEKDVESLMLTRTLIDKRKQEVTGYSTVIGFKPNYNQTDELKNQESEAIILP